MIFKDKFLKNNILMFAAISLTNLGNLLCQLIVVRKLPISGYGAFNSLLSVFMIIALPASSLAAMVMKFASAYNNTGERKKADFFILIMLRHMFFAAGAILVAYLIFGVNFRNYLRLSSIVPVYIVGGMLFLTIISTVMLGGLQGLEKFEWFGLSTTLSAFFKIGLVFAFMHYLPWGLNGALWAYLFSMAICVFIVFIPLREIFFLKGEAEDIDLKEKYKFVAPSLITLGCVAALTNMDVILVKHFFSAQEAGNYSVAQMMGKIVFFIPAAVSLVMMPSASGLHARAEDSRQVLRRSLQYTAAACLLVLVFYNIFPAFILGLLTGKATEDSIFLGRLFCIAMTVFSLVNVLAMYQLSISKFKFLRALGLFTFLQILGILLFHSSTAQVLFILILNSMILLVINFRYSFAEEVKKA